jgi:hypothetical protein
MKFTDLYSRVFIQEQNAPSDVNTEVAHPDDFNDVEPLPVPEPSAQSTEPGETPMTSSSLMDYMNQCNDFADKLQSASGECLQSLVMSLDKPLTPFEGISRISADVEDAAEKLKRISGRLLSFNIAATKK